VSAGGIAILVASIVVPLAVVFTALFVWLRRRMRAAAANLAAVLADEPALRGPEGANYQGCTGGYSQVMGSGQIALTARRLLFQKAVGGLVEVPLAEVTATGEAKVFNRGVVGGRMHLVVHTHRGDVGYLVSDTSAWRQAIEQALPRR
jgi:hypothetical protein